MTFIDEDSGSTGHGGEVRGGLQYRKGLRATKASILSRDDDGENGSSSAERGARKKKRRKKRGRKTARTERTHRHAISAMSNDRK